MKTKRRKIKVVNCLLLGKTDSQNRRVEFPYIKGLTFEAMYKKHSDISGSIKIELRDPLIEEEYMTLDHIPESELIAIIKDAIEDNTFDYPEGGFCPNTGLAYDSSNLSFVKTGSYCRGDSSEPRWHDWVDDGYTICPHCRCDTEDHTQDVSPAGVLSDTRDKLINILGYDSWEDLEDEEDLLEAIEELASEYIADLLGADGYEFKFGGFGYESDFTLDLKGGDGCEYEPYYED